jgi:hypothetical protein
LLLRQEKPDAATALFDTGVQCLAPFRIHWVAATFGDLKQILPCGNGALNVDFGEI